MNKKQCNTCKRELPSDLEHFYRHKTCKGGLKNTCKECRGSNFGVKVMNRAYETKEGYKFCSCCKKELPLSSIYFDKSSRAKDHYTSKCKKCDGRNYEIKKPNEVIKSRDGFKICSVCREEKIYNDFYKSKYSKDEHTSRCKKCEATVKRMSFQNNPLWLKAHKEYQKRYRKKYYSTQKGKLINVLNCQRRRNRRNQLETSFNEESWMKLLDLFDHRCAYCGEEKELQHEHFIPLSKDGEYTINNILPACQFCNISKHSKSFFEWYPNYKGYNKTRERKILEYLNYIDKESQQLTLNV